MKRDLSWLIIIGLVFILFLLSGCSSNNASNSQNKYNVAEKTKNIENMNQTTFDSQTEDIANKNIESTHSLEKTLPPTPNKDDNLIVNEKGKMLNSQNKGNQIIKVGDYFYYISAFGEKLYKVKYNGQGREILDSNIGYGKLYFFNNTLYYFKKVFSQSTEVEEIWGIDIDNNKKKLFFEFSSNDFDSEGQKITDNKEFLGFHFSKSKIVIFTDKSIEIYDPNMKLLNEIKADNITNNITPIEVNNWVYFNKTDGIYKLSLENNEILKLCEGSTDYNFIIKDNCIYYISYPEIHRMDLNGNNNFELTTNRKSSVSASKIGDIKNGWVYFTGEDALTHYFIFRQNQTNGERQQLTYEKDCHFTCIINDNILYDYCNFSDVTPYITEIMNLDGSDRKHYVDEELCGLTEIDGAIWSVSRNDNLYKIDLSDNKIENITDVN